MTKDEAVSHTHHGPQDVRPGEDGMTSQGPLVERDPVVDKTRVLARLRQATWEATQFLAYDEVAAYVAGVLREIESDEP
jgi:hypothetical protein